MENKLYSSPANPVIADKNVHALGLTKLEAFTMAAMQGLCATDNYGTKILSELAIEIAKATLDKLAKES